MDETPEEMEEIRREAAQIDPYKYRTRKRWMAGIALGALGAGLIWVVLDFTDRARNPCQRVRDHFCAKGQGATCSVYEGILKESVEDPSPRMRGMIRDQCVIKIKRLKEEEGIKVR